MSQPPDRMTEADARRSRALCYTAAAVFAGCACLSFALPVSLPVRAVLGGFNFVVAAAVILYARTLKSEP